MCVPIPLLSGERFSNALRGKEERGGVPSLPMAWSGIPGILGSAADTTPPAKFNISTGCISGVREAERRFVLRMFCRLVWGLRQLRAGIYNVHIRILMISQDLNHQCTHELCNNPCTAIGLTVYLSSEGANHCSMGFASRATFWLTSKRTAMLSP